MNSKILREKRNSFWLKNDHKHLPEVSLIASKESTAMFNVAGMQQLIPYLLGKEHPIGSKLFNIQKCIRTNDIDEVGDDHHLTFFEMMGNRSLGDYFKKESVEYSYNFLVNELGLDPKKIAVTVFQGDKNTPKDTETANYRENIGIAKHKISFMGIENNRRTPGPVGPCGPDTEIFYRVGEGFPSEGNNPKDDEINWVEIRNNVFMEYYNDDKGTLNKLQNKNVDTGMGFERMCMIIQNKNNVFETDLFMPIINLLEQSSGLSYQDNKKRFRIITDHIRTAIMLINDGVVQSNVGNGYVLRMIIRRMYYNILLLKEISDEDIKLFIKKSIDFLSDIRPIKKQEVFDSLFSEISTFKNTINNGLKILKEKLEKNNSKILGSQDSFFLYDTCGFPIELTREICKEKGFKIDEEGFKKQLELQKERSREKSKFQKDIDRSKYLSGIPHTKFIGYSAENLIFDKNISILKDFEVDGQRVLVFDKTPFYGESGGQIGDSGTLMLDSGKKLKIKTVKKYDGIFLHFVE